MLAEFAFTPSVFDQSAHSDLEEWREQLRELGTSMFPRTGAWPVMVSNLYGGSWHEAALLIVKSIEDQSARILCEKLLENVRQTLVHRQIDQDEWPGDDSLLWAKEAIGSHKKEPIDRIVACNVIFERLKKDTPAFRSIDHVGHSGFWDGVSSAWSQTMKVSDQVLSIRKLCVHSQFVSLVTPHIKGGSDDETDFALGLIESVFRQPVAKTPCDIEIHTEAPDRPATSDFEQRLDSRVRAITASLKSVIPRGRQVQLVVWPKLLDRYIIAGVMVEMPDKSKARSPRWGMSMQHLARRQDDRNSTPPTSWSLITRGQLSDQFDRYCKPNLKGNLRRSIVTQ